MANFFDRFDPVNSAGAGKLPPGYVLDPQRPAPKGRLYFDDLIPQGGSAASPTQAAGRLNFDDIVPQGGSAPTQSGRYFDDVPSGRPGLNFDDLVPKNQSALPPGYVLDQPKGGNVFDQFDPKGADASDIAKSGGIGVLKGIIGLAGSPSDLGNVGAQGIDAATRFVERKLGLPEFAAYDPNQPTLTGYRLPGAADIQSGVEQATGPLYQPKSELGRYAETAGSFVPGMIGGPEGLGARLMGRVIAPGVASEAAGQATQGTALEPYARIAGAVAGASAPAALSRAISPMTIDAARAGAVNTLDNAGVTALTAGQRSGSRALKYMESELGDAFGAGNQATRANDLVNEQFTTAALNRAGVQGATRATPDVIDTAFDNNSNQFNSIAARNPAIPIPSSFWNDAARVADDYEGLTGQRSPLLDRFTAQIGNPATGSPAISGDAYQAIQSDIARFARAATQPELKSALYDYRAALDDAMQRGLTQIGNTGDAQAWRQARGDYKNLLVLERAAGGTSETAAQGFITPAALAIADKAINGRRNFVRGNTPFADLAQAGNAVMKPLPQSGTAPRAAAHLLPAILGGALGHGTGDAMAGVMAGAAAPAIMGRVVHSTPVQAYLRNQAAVPLRQGVRRNLMRGAALAALPAAQGQ